MTKEEFKNWQSFMGYKNQEAANALGVSRDTIDKYRQGYPISKTIAKLCEYLMQCKINIEP